MAISFVSASEISSQVNSTNYTINKPSGIASGDFLVAVVFFSDTFVFSQTTVNVPAGWTKVRDAFADPGGNNYVSQLAVMTKTAGSSEPGSWSGSFGSSKDWRVVCCAAYRGASGIVANNYGTAGNATSLSTNSVTNSAASNWRITAGGYTSASVSYALESNEIANRALDDEGGHIYSGIWDSGGTIGTGSTSRTISRGATWASACSWIGILDASDTAVTGTLDATLPKMTMTASGSQSYDGVLAATLPKPTMTATAIGTPPEGPLSVAITPVMTATGATAASGTLGVLLAPVMTVVGETRTFGIRVVTPEAESRTTTPRRGAVD